METRGVPVSVAVEESTEEVDANQGAISRRKGLP